MWHQLGLQDSSGRMVIVIRESFTAFKDTDLETLLIKLGSRTQLGFLLLLLLPTVYQSP